MGADGIIIITKLSGVRNQRAWGEIESNIKLFRQQ